MRHVETYRDSFVATKLIPPQWDECGVERSALLSGLTAGKRTVSVLSIVATAGSGKSTLLSQLHHMLGLRGWSTCWISLDADDNNPTNFAGYFIAALGHIDPRIAERDFALQKDYPVRAFDELFLDLVAHVSTIEGKTAIFLDDFQHIVDPHVLAFINRLIAHLPASVQLFIASRTRPPLELGRVRVSGALVEIEQEDLNFSASEAADFLRVSHNLKLPPEDFESLLSTTEGWAAGLQLAAIALRRHRGSPSELIRQFSGRDQDLTTYLAETVLNSQSEGVRTFLLHTAPLRRMCAELCQAASHHPDPGEMLAYLERSKLFVIPLDRAGQWYRYHHLFGEFLQNQLLRTAPDTFNSICDRASQWCESRGMITEAIQYALDARRFDKAADMIADRAIAVSQIEGDHSTILDWMRRLPQEFHLRRPQIGLSHAWARAFSRDTDLAMKLSDQVLLELRTNDRSGWKLSAPERQRLRHFGHAIQAVAKASADEIENCKSRSLELRKQVPEDEPFIIASACNCIGYAHLAKREFDSATRISADAYLYGQRAASPYAMVWGDFIHGVADVELGRLRTAQEHARRSEVSAGAARLMKSYTGAMAALLNAEIATQRCEFTRAKSHMDLGRSFALVFGPVEPLLLAYRNDARISAWAGDLPTARAILSQGRDVAIRSKYPRLFLHLAIEEINLQIIAGQDRQAAETAKTFNLFDETSSINRFETYRSMRNILRLLEIQLILSKADHVSALRLLFQLQHSMGDDSESNLQLTIKGLRACALWQADRKAESLRELDRAIASAADEFCVYPLAACGRGLLPILRVIRERREDDGAPAQNARTHFAQCLTAILSGAAPKLIDNPAVGVFPVSTSEVLTLREVELLKLVEAGLPNKKLADSLLISESTVKWHLHNINEKLGVGNRTAAAAKARELMLI